MLYYCYLVIKEMSYDKLLGMLNSDVLEIICKFLHPKDIIILYKNYNKTRKINRILKNMFIKRLGEEIDLYLQNYFDEDFKDFKDCMIKSNACISGSLILQICYDDFYIPDKMGEKILFDEYDHDKISSNINIFTFNKPINKKKYSFQIMYNDLHKFFKEDHKGLFLVGEYFHSYLKMGEDVILLSRYYTDYINVIDVNNDKYNDYETFINECVDFSICQNFFCYNKDNTFKLRILHLEDLLNKRSSFNYIGSIEKSIKRCEKYIQRGISFYIHQDVVDFKIVNRINKLTEKYSENNFKLYPLN